MEDYPQGYNSERLNKKKSVKRETYKELTNFYEGKIFF